MSLPGKWVWYGVAALVAALGVVAALVWWGGALANAWGALQPADRAPFVSGLFTLVSALAAAWVVFAQIKRNADAQRRLQTESDTRKLRLEVYEKGSEVCRAASDALTNVRVRSLLIAEAMGQHLRGGYNAIPESNPLDRDQFASLNKEACDRATDAIFWVEKWLIIEPRMDIFRFAISAALHDIIEAAKGVDALYPRFFETPILKSQPVPLSGKPGHSEYFSFMDRAWAACKRFATAADVAESYTGDLLAALQNILLAQMFGSEVPPRRHIDPASFPITIEGHAEVRERLNDTPFGRQVARVQEEVRERLRKRGVTPAD